MARFTLLIFIILGSIVTAFGQSSQSLQGTVTDIETGEPLMFATVALKKGGQLITGAQTDFDGKYSFNGIDAGEYDVEVSYVGYQTKTTSGVVIFAGKALTLNIQMSQGVELEEIVVTYTVPLVEQDNTTQGTVVTSKEIDKLASKSINGIVAQSAGVSSADDGGAISIRGSRSNATDYYIDGIRVSGSMIPQSEIEQLQVITGGIPASIGDITGGVISVTTKGPSRQFNGTAEVETSELLDGYQYRLGMLSLSGPLLKNDKGESIIGYRFSGQYRSNTDRSPSAVGVYKIKDDVYDRLSADPLVQITSGGSLVAVPAANFLTEDDVELVKTRPNSADVRYDATGKFDIQVTKNMDIAIGGSFNHRQAQPVTNALLNYGRNRTEYDTDARGFFRFRHRIGGATTATDAEKASSGTSIQNASYTLQMSYNLTKNRASDPIHGDNLTNYGYIGDFDHSENAVTGPTFDPDDGTFLGFQHIGNFYRLDSYTPSDINAPLTNYNKFVEDFDSRNDFPYFNGNRPQAQMTIYIYTRM
ncbi:MAG: TonB-dependent receptor plug domain-containing protein [Saprospiraceae bacterium]|nr:TonB-dependent receptor plug domain-containing protein [Saprospiraceae bacterium]